MSAPPFQKDSDSALLDDNVNTGGALRGCIRGSVPLLAGIAAMATVTGLNCVGERGLTKNPVSVSFSISVSMSVSVSASMSVSVGATVCVYVSATVCVCICICICVCPTS